MLTLFHYYYACSLPVFYEMLTGPIHYRRTMAPALSAARVEAMIAERVAAALVAYEISCNGRGGGTPVSTGGSGGNLKPYSYKDFRNCKPYNYAGNWGVIELTRWFEKTRSVF